MKSVSFLTALRLLDRQGDRKRPVCDENMGDEGALLERARQSDSQALGELYDRYAGRIHTYILCHVGNQELAEDLTANVFIKMLDAVRTSNAWQTSFSGWLYRIAHNAMIDHFRKRDHGPTLPLDEQLVSAEDNPVVAVDQIMRSEMVGEALLRLTEEQQLVIACKFFQGLTNAQIADLMGKTEGAIKSLQYRALGTLRRVLEGASKEADEKH
jgi:RNA polymerase sigma-70 factor, ECF subfamily